MASGPAAGPSGTVRADAPEGSSAVRPGANAAGIAGEVYGGAVGSGT
jgi:hypothetical protein